MLHDPPRRVRKSPRHRRAAPRDPARRPPRWRGALGWALAVVLLAAAGLIVFLRLQPPAFAVTGATIAQQARSGCGVNVTGRIATSGGTGTVSYQWVFRPGGHAPQRLAEAVAAGQKAVLVSVAVEGSGHGRAAQSVTLQVLSPGRRAASTSVIIRC